jgi:hypothetical protein
MSHSLGSGPKVRDLSTIGLKARYRRKNYTETSLDECATEDQPLFSS